MAQRLNEFGCTRDVGFLTVDLYNPSYFLQDLYETPTKPLADHMHLDMVLEAHVALGFLWC